MLMISTRVMIDRYMQSSSSNPKAMVGYHDELSSSYALHCIALHSAYGRKSHI